MTHLCATLYPLCNPVCATLDLLCNHMCTTLDPIMPHVGSHTSIPTHRMCPHGPPLRRRRSVGRPVWVDCNVRCAEDPGVHVAPIIALHGPIRHEALRNAPSASNKGILVCARQTIGSQKRTLPFVNVQTIGSQKKYAPLFYAQPLTCHWPAGTSCGVR